MIRLCPELLTVTHVTAVTLRLKELAFLRVVEEAILSKAFKDALYMRDVGVATARVDDNII